MENTELMQVMPETEECTESRESMERRAADYREQIISMLDDMEDNDIRFLRQICTMTRVHLSKQREKERMFKYH